MARRVEAPVRGLDVRSIRAAQDAGFNRLPRRRGARKSACTSLGMAARSAVPATGGIAINPALTLGGWASFKPAHGPGRYLRASRLRGANAFRLIQMNSDASGTSRDHAELWRSVAVRSEYYTCRGLIIAVGICWSVSFVVVGLRYELQLYGDGSIFSYAIAVQDAWAFHWHNISGRLFVFLFSHMPAETYVELTGDAHGGVVVYGLLFFAAQSLGLAATFAADRFKGRIIFSYACYSTACLCPLVFGSPTEVWMSHALFWPTLAGCHRIRHGVRGAAVIFGMMLALVLTHDGALIFAIAILMTLFLRGMRDAAFVRSLIIFFLAMLIWGVIKKTYPPDPYMAEVMSRAAMHVFDIN